MYLTIEDGKIVVEPITREQEKELRQMAKDRVPLDVVKAKFIRGGSRLASDQSPCCHTLPKVC